MIYKRRQKEILCFLLSAKHETFLKYLLDFHNVKKTLERYLFTLSKHKMFLRHLLNQKDDLYITLIGETFARQTFTRSKIREYLEENFLVKFAKVSLAKASQNKVRDLSFLVYLLCLVSCVVCQQF